jgi:hypothetical protein
MENRCVWLATLGISHRSFYVSHLRKCALTIHSSRTRFVASGLHPASRAGRLNSGVMRQIILPAILAIALSACASSLERAERAEPADVIASGKTVPQLLRLGWQIAAPISASEAESQGKLASYEPWNRFKASILAGDELRPVSHNAGEGYAQFRKGVLVDMFLTVIY